MFMDRDEVEVHKLAKKEQGQYPAILTEHRWSVKDLWLSGKFFLQDTVGSQNHIFNLLAQALSTLIRFQTKTELFCSVF